MKTRSRTFDGRDPDRLLASYDPPQLPPGEYNLQVTLVGGSGASRTSSTRFVVGA